MKYPTTYEKLSKFLERYVNPSTGERVKPCILPAIGLHDGELGAEPRELGTTRFGGKPDLSESQIWLEGPHGPLAFLGQVSFSEIRLFDLDRVLPETGLLSFFYNIYDPAFGLRAIDRERFAVLHTPAPHRLWRRDFPPAIRKHNKIDIVRQVKPYLRWQLPTADPLALATIGMSEWFPEEPDAFTDECQGIENEFTRKHIPVGTHKMLGWANGIFQQNEDARLMCEVARRDFPDQDSPEHNGAIADRKHWRCLLEIGDNRDLYQDGWSDGGTTAFMIRDDDLKKRDFSGCWCVLSTS